MQLYIDADTIVYKACLVSEFDIDFGNDVIVVQADFEHIKRIINKSLTDLRDLFGVSEQQMILFFSGKNNFRKALCPTYKGNRGFKKKPCGYRRAIDWLSEQYEVKIEDTLEADDLLGIYQTMNQHHDNIIVSVDKDLKQIPGRIYDYKSLTTVTRQSGNKLHLIQTLTGDTVDGYPGCKGIGIKKANSLINQYGTDWNAVIDAFLNAGHDSEYALLQARLARILHYDQYNFHTQQIELWTPTT